MELMGEQKICDGGKGKDIDRWWKKWWKKWWENGGKMAEKMVEKMVENGGGSGKRS